GRGLYVGRFQPFHLGHLCAVKKILGEVDEVIVAIGSAQYSHNVNNPFTAGERLVMIREALRDEKMDLSRVWLVPVPDVHLHMMWVSALEGYTPRFAVVYSNEPLTRRLFVEAGYEVKDIPLYDRRVYSSAEIRKRMVKGEDWEEYVPRKVSVFIKEIDGVNRLRDLNRSDRV
ncbi:nicotinamide-nucleotide adenylyltransferase, partial [Candidatus Bathyarchaeota archaeon]|nr:nicotinamide-nucleotide adenylyltransferase [Candidatus Bathyarchaeota archaeon]